MSEEGEISSDVMQYVMELVFQAEQPTKEELCEKVAAKFKNSSSAKTAEDWYNKFLSDSSLGDILGQLQFMVERDAEEVAVSIQSAKELGFGKRQTVQYLVNEHKGLDKILNLSQLQEVLAVHDTTADLYSSLPRDKAASQKKKTAVASSDEDFDDFEMDELDDDEIDDLLDEVEDELDELEEAPKKTETKKKKPKKKTTPVGKRKRAPAAPQSSKKKATPPSKKKTTPKPKTKTKAKSKTTNTSFSGNLLTESLASVEMQLASAKAERKLLNQRLREQRENLQLLEQENN